MWVCRGARSSRTVSLVVKEKPKPLEDSAPASVRGQEGSAHRGQGREGKPGGAHDTSGGVRRAQPSQMNFPAMQQPPPAKPSPGHAGAAQLSPRAGQQPPGPAEEGGGRQQQQQQRRRHHQHQQQPPQQQQQPQEALSSTWQPSPKAKQPPPPTPAATPVAAPVEAQCTARIEEQATSGPSSPAACGAAPVLHNRRVSIAGAKESVPAAVAAAQDGTGSSPKDTAAAPKSTRQVQVAVTTLPPLAPIESPKAFSSKGKGALSSKKVPATPAVSGTAAPLPYADRSPTQTLKVTRGREPKYGTWAWTAERDLPPEVRGVHEENKMLIGEIRRARQRMHEQEASLAAQEKALSGLRAEVAKLQRALMECSVTPQELLEEAQYRQELQQRDRQQKQLQLRLEVLEKAKESAARRHKVDLAEERKHAEGLAKELAALRATLEEKDRQARMTTLHMRSLYQRLEAFEKAAKEPSAQQAAPASPAPCVSEEKPPEERVHVMLCVVYDRPQPTAAELAERRRLAAVEAAYNQLVQQRQQRAALKIQKHFRGYTVRKQLRQQRRAAMRIQAGVRLMLARRSTANSENSTISEEKQGASTADRLRERQREAEMRHARRSLTRRRGMTQPAPPPEAEQTARSRPSGRRNSELISRASYTAAVAGGFLPAMVSEPPTQRHQGGRPGTITPEPLTRISGTMLGGRTMSFSKTGSFFKGV